jgi:hypothetical protein
MLFGQRAHALRFLENPPRAGHDLPGRRRGRHAPQAPIEQHDAEVILELLDLRAERRLSDVAGLRGMCEVSGVGERNHVAQVLEVHRSPSSIPSITLFYTIHWTDGSGQA